MTLKQFHSKEIWRPIKSTIHHEISNRGRIRNKMTGYVIKCRQTANVTNISEYANHMQINVRIVMLSAFQDIEVTDYIKAKLSRNKQRVTGVYKFNNEDSKKKWRVIIQKNNKQFLFGYFRTKDEATEVATRNWLMLNQDKIERYL